MELRVTEQGSIHVETARLLRVGENVVAIEVVLEQKRCEVQGVGGNEMWLGVNEHTLHADGDKWTVIEFPEYVGWEVWAAEVVKYTLAVCLIRPEEENGITD
jgi:hypothetical protein